MLSLLKHLPPSLVGVNPSSTYIGKIRQVKTLLLGEEKLTDIVDTQE